MNIEASAYWMPAFAGMTKFNRAADVFLLPVFFLIVRLPPFFRFREQALQDCALVLVGLFRKQLVKVLHVALCSDLIDHSLPSVRRRLGCCREFNAQKEI
jgi:hypothetical protein